jgi:uncharacterized protein YuzE
MAVTYDTDGGNKKYIQILNGKPREKVHTEDKGNDKRIIL